MSFEVENYPRLLYIGSQHIEILSELEDLGFPIEKTDTALDAHEYIQNCIFARYPLPEILLIDEGEEGIQALSTYIQFLGETPNLSALPIVLMGREDSKRIFHEARRLKLGDVFTPPFSSEQIQQRLLDLKLTYSVASQSNSGFPSVPRKNYKLPLWKRTFDIIGASLIILLLSPLFLAIIALIRLESKGPIFYVSKRVGTGYKIFGFFKFRSMRINADAMLDKLKKENNQYAQQAVVEKEKELVTTAAGAGGIEEVFLVQDDEIMAENAFLEQKKFDDENAFVKIENDPRITKVGKFIRNTSIDELPQLFNVLKGDMSLVGNRPLPLYEAEKLTDDESSLRFMAPAGITGLWQVEDRGSSEVSAESRKKWDIIYAENFSLWMDLKILLKTIPAVIQKANV
ncbi:MAG: sugar transferase [Bacteroidota bacterium]